MPHGANWGGVPSASPYLTSALLAVDKSASTTRSDLLACASITPTVAEVTVHFTCSFGGNVSGSFWLEADGVQVGQVGAFAQNGRCAVAITQRLTVAPGMPVVIGVTWAAKQVGALACQPVSAPDLDHASIVVTL